MSLREQYIAFQTILIKEILRFVRIWIQTLVPPAVTTALYFIVFGSLIGSQIGDMDGVAYIDYIVPGLILMAIITHVYGNVVASFFSAKFQKNIEEMLVSPMPNYIILLGYVAGGVARGLAVGLIVVVIALFFTELRVYHWGITLSIMLLTSVLFSLGGFINAAYARNFEDISIVPNFVLTPLTYLGGIFYTIKMLPEFWQTVSLANPILYMINAFRYGMLGVSDIDVGVAFALTLAVTAGLFVWALRLLDRGISISH